MYYYSSPTYYSDPCLYPSGGVSVSAPYVNLSITRSAVVGDSAAETLPPPLPGSVTPIMPPPSDLQTFPYDGGPRIPAPMPNADPPSVPLPIQAKPAAAPVKMAGRIAYPAYGERLSGPAADQTVVVKAK